jgi:ribosomal protein S27E
VRAASGRPLPDYVQEEFDAYLKCGRLEEGFLRVRCEQCHAEKLVAFSCKKRGFCPSCGARRMAETAALLAGEVLPECPLRQWVLSLPMAPRFLLAINPEALTLVLGVVYRTISRHLIDKAGLTRTTGNTVAVTLVQRFGSALNLNVHFHMIYVDSVYLVDGEHVPIFRHVPAPTGTELQSLVQRIAERVGRVLEKRGLIERDIESAWLAANAEPGPLDDLIGHSITYRIAVGPRAGQKRFTLQKRTKLERLCRYVSRPPVAEDRLTLTASGQESRRSSRRFWRSWRRRRRIGIRQNCRWVRGPAQLPAHPGNGPDSGRLRQSGSLHEGDCTNQDGATGCFELPIRNAEHAYDQGNPRQFYVGTHAVIPAYQIETAPR